LYNPPAVEKMWMSRLKAVEKLTTKKYFERDPGGFLA
jgi:hypothetical protein